MASVIRKERVWQHWQEDGSALCKMAHHHVQRTGTCTKNLGRGSGEAMIVGVFGCFRVNKNGVPTK